MTEDTQNLRFNTAIAAMMTALNDLVKLPELPRSLAETLAIVLAPYAPHLAEELWEKLGHAPSVCLQSWPTFDPALCVAETIEMPVQVNGKLRGKLTVSPQTPQAELQALALADVSVQKWLEGNEIVKVIVVLTRMVSIVVKG